MRAGDAQITARVHLVFGRLEGKAGHYDTALKHFDLARAVLSVDHSLWISSAIDLDHASIVGLCGDYIGAVKLASRGMSDATASGWLKGQALAATNLAFFHAMLGNDAEARHCLESTPGRFAATAAYRIATAETLAQLAFSSGDFHGALEILNDTESESPDSLCWYEVSRAITRAQILLASGDNHGAERCATDAIPKATQLQNASAEAMLRLLVTEASLDGELGVDVSKMVTSDEARSPELQATASLVLGKTLRRAGVMASGSDILRRGVRLLDLLNAPSHLRAEAATPEDLRGTVQHASATLDAAVALLDLAGHPHILGAEAVALLKGSRCAARLALVAAGPSGVRVVDSLGWDSPEAAAAAAAPADAIEHLPLGRRTDETWTLVVEPVRELEPYCTFAAIRKLLALALSLDGYRRDEKQRAALWPADALDGDSECVWASEQMSEILTTARRIAAAPAPLPVLITGETGTGKEMVARAIHRASDRADRPFLPFNCAAVPREMLESQLFGYRKGAFTSADSGFQGVIRAAAGGTLFLDEIGEIGADIQPKLLRFLETHEIHPLGEPHPITVDVRVIAATNASVERLIADGKFRDDLFYRLNVMRLSLPPLRERREEIPPLVQHHVRKFADEQRKGCLTVSDETLEYLLLYSWPGNVRQLANEIRRMVALAEADSTLTPALLSPEIQASRRTIAATPSLDIEARVPLDQPLPVAVEMLEQLMVRRALDRTHGRVEEASRLLGISRKGLFLKRRRWGFSQVS
jgi:DNA-binding NtrC family response regulator